MRSDVSIPSHGLNLAGWHYTPQGGGRRPAIVMAHGISAVKDQGLDGFAAAFCKAGFAVTVIDYRNQGASPGPERGRIVPAEQHDDIRAAIAWTAERDDVDATRIGLWGSSFSGGHALWLGALDPRVKVIVAQVPAIDLAASFMSLAGEAGFRGLLGMMADDHAARTKGAAPGRIPMVAPEGQPALLNTPDSYAWFMAHAVPSWLNETTLESVARAAEYKPAAFIELIAPKPLLIVAATGDSLIPIAHVRAAFARAGEPKRLIEHEAGHFDFYPGSPLHDEVAAAETAWFTAHL
jgi:fermentation-respiration switch protein FrsA (DUF1100 family)